MVRGNFKKYCSLFNAISSILEWVLSMEQVNEWKENIRNINETKPKLKIARLINIPA